ncbi:hypothetical protein BBP40_011656 [Aspergillus hancockii]|nr:hypothetical protein BBP40_011656 [Aspergillus hancockii]
MAPTFLLFVGTFVHLPRTTSEALEIWQGALWVSTADGRIKGFDRSIFNEDDLSVFLKTKGWVLSDDGPCCKSKTSVTIIRAREKQNEFFFPGFIDTHIHAPQYPNCGIFGCSTLLEWLNTYVYPMEASFGGSLSSAPPRASMVYNQAVSRTLAHGTTFAAYYGTIHVPATNLLATICQKRGQRALIGRVCMDRKEKCPEYYRDNSAKESVKLTHNVISYIRSIDPHGILVKPVVTPRFALACTEKALTDLGKLANDSSPNLFIQAHIAENEQEVKDVESMYKMKYARVYDKFRLLTPRTILAHGVHLSSAEHKLIHTREAKIAHCPTSNSALASGICPVRKLLDRGITVGLGTDVSGGYSPSILEVVRQACLVSRLLPAKECRDSCDNCQRECGNDDHAEGSREEDTPDESYLDQRKDDKSSKRYDPVLSVEEALYLATRGGAAVVNMANEIGGFDIGMSWDAQLIHLGAFLPAGKYRNEESHVDIFGWEKWEEKIHKWVWNGDDRNVKAVWVAGKMVFGNGGTESK